VVFRLVLDLYEALFYRIFFRSAEVFRDENAIMNKIIRNGNRIFENERSNTFIKFDERVTRPRSMNVSFQRTRMQMLSNV